MKFELIDDSILYVSEVTIQESQWFEYGYQWMNVDNELIIRWDNSPYHTDIETSPFHQHIGSDENIHSSESMTLYKVLLFIANQIS
ncbi:DUF6516 family protein [Emticicia sp.]|uniref:toxin-antitoxin system TumE family protein n=1 Tax=Emticicia sp. TaxID=1930953 RepID=UPI0037537992